MAIISDSLVLSILKNEKLNASLLGLQFKVGWIKTCAWNRIIGYSKARKFQMISSQAFFARVCAAFILNDLFLLNTLFHILWRLLFFLPHKELVLFSKKCLDRELIDEYNSEEFHKFLNEMVWLNKRRFFISQYDLKNTFTLAQLYIMSRDDIKINTETIFIFNNDGKKTIRFFGN